MRTIDPVLTAALSSGNGQPIITAYLGNSSGHASVTATPISYKLTGTTLDVEFFNAASQITSSTHVWLKRGLLIGGVEYTLTTSLFAITSIEFPPNRIIAHAQLFPKQYYSAEGYDTYQNVLSAFCTTYGKTAVFPDLAEAWLGYTFLPSGKQIICNNASNFLNLIRQKYLVFACDNGSEEVLFYTCALTPGLAVKTYSPQADLNRIFTYPGARLFMWRDEAGTVHTDGTATDPIHNLGYLESTADAPSQHSVLTTVRLTTRPDFEIQDGDIFGLSFGGLTYRTHALVTEEYTAPDHGHPHPRWFTTIESNPVFANTEGGAMPSTIERISNYTPLNTSMFNGVLSASDNNLQAAMDTLDNHSHGASGGSFIFASHGNAVGAGAGATWYMVPGVFIFSATDRSLGCPRAGTLSRLKVRTSTAQPTGGALTITVQINGSPTSITITIPAGTAAGFFTDLTNTADVAEDDLIQIKFANAAPSAVSARILSVTLELAG